MAGRSIQANVIFKGFENIRNHFDYSRRVPPAFVDLDALSNSFDYSLMIE